MTKYELGQLYRLNKEIELDKQRLAELRQKNSGNVLCGSNAGHGKGQVSDATGELAILICEQKALIETKLKKAYEEQNRLYRFIENIGDSEMRQILELRYIRGKTWLQVAIAVGEYDESYVRRKTYAYIEKLAENVG